jgi:hypothetical protein
MNDDSGGRRGLQQACALAAAASIAVLLTACGGGGSSAGNGKTPFEKAQAYAQCMRSKGDPKFPDPNSQGIFISGPGDREVFAGPQYQRANSACAKLTPPGFSAAQDRLLYQVQLKFAACMRSHGVVNFPDPSSGGHGFGHVAAINYQSPGYMSADRTCDQIPGAEGL